MDISNDTDLQALTFATNVLAIAKRYAMSVTSWGRTEAHNKAVGGVADSQHLKWLAVDVVLDAGVNHTEFVNAVEESGLMPIDEGTHVHIQARRV
jgi:uncharacterized surface protein with fasciclin (FAS1) repeats